MVWCPVPGQYKWRGPLAIHMPDIRSSLCEAVAQSYSYQTQAVSKKLCAVTLQTPCGLQSWAAFPQCNNCKQSGGTTSLRRGPSASQHLAGIDINSIFSQYLTPGCTAAPMLQTTGRISSCAACESTLRSEYMNPDTNFDACTLWAGLHRAAAAAAPASGAGWGSLAPGHLWQW